MNKLQILLLVVTATFTFSTSLQASVLLPGNVIFPAGDTAVTAPNKSGVVQNDNLIPFSYPITQLTVVGGNVQNRVVLSNNLNTMVFGPRIRDTFNIATIGFEIIGFTLDGYTGWATDVGYSADGQGDNGPSSVSRSADGDILTFRYADPLFISGLAPGPQEESLFPFIITDAPSYSLTGSMTIFGIDTANPGDLLSLTIDGLAVPSAVPVPSAVWFFGSGLVGLVGVARRKKLIK